MTGTKRRRLAGLVGAVTLVVTAGLTSAATASAAGDHAATQALLNQYLAQAGPGAAVYAGNATESWTLSSGTARVNTATPITAGMHFRIGSQTKTFVSVVVLQLVDEGRVELDAPIARYLPGVVNGNYDGDVITVRQLLQHTSGMVRDVRDARANADGSYDLAELVRSAMDEPPQSAPGAAVNYSNVAYLVLGMLVERLTGEDVGTAITARIIAPLHLAGTSFPARGQRALASPYLPGYAGGRIPPFFLWYETTTTIELTYWNTAGNMASTLSDLAVFFGALDDGRLISPAALAEMRRVVPVGVYGAGLGIDRVPLSCGGVAWAKNGGLPTGHSSVTAVTDDGRFASVVTNTFHNSTAAGNMQSAVLDSALCEGNNA